MINSKYFRIPKKKEPLQENEVHVTSRQEPINFLRYAIFLFEKRNLPYIKFKASGSAIASLVNIAEILKKVIPGVHQVNRIYTLKFEQEYEPKEKGLDRVTIVRNVPILEITFSKVILGNDDDNHYGYQPALSQEVFERVKINVTNLIRKQTNPGYDNYYKPKNEYYHDYDTRGHGGYRAGFRGRGGRFTPGFRGRMRGREKFNTGETQGTVEVGRMTSEFTENDGQPKRGIARVFGKYRSKFDNQEQRPTNSF